MLPDSDADELAIRERLHDLLERPPAAPADDAGEEGEEDDGEHADLEDPAVPVQRRPSPRLPDWWSPDRPHLAAEAEPEEPDPDPPAGESEEPEGTKESVPAPAAAPAGDTGDEDQDDSSGAAGHGPKPKWSVPFPKVRSWQGWHHPRRARKPRHRPRFAAPGIPHTMKAERRSLLEIIRSTPDHVRWMTYSGSALAAGFYLGWPQWFRDGTAYLAAEHPTLTDGYSITCYGLAAVLFLLDYGARGWVFPVAWAARIPTASLVVGVPLYGVDIPISQLF